MKNQTNLRSIVALIFALCCLTGAAQPLSNLPFWEKQKSIVETDWLIKQPDAKAQLFQTKDGKLVISNGLVARTFSLKPNGATVGLDLLANNESFLRSVRPEAEVEINGLKLKVGGLTSQPIQNYLLPEWLAKMEADPNSFKLVDYTIGETKARFPGRKNRHGCQRTSPGHCPVKN